ncbi:hypothetical protein Tco_0605200, partial [Tanacetum coccineum]
DMSSQLLALTSSFVVDVPFSGVVVTGTNTQEFPFSMTSHRA